MNTLSELENHVAEDGLTHEHMCDFFRLLNSSASVHILPTFIHWTETLRTAGVVIEEDWYNRMVKDFTEHGRLTVETLLQAPVQELIEIGADTDAD